MMKEEAIGLVLEDATNFAKLSEQFRDDFVVCYADPKLGWDVSAALAPLGEKLHVLHTVQETAAVAASLAQKGDDILVMSNGGFGGIHGQLLSLLKNKG